MNDGFQRGRAARVLVHGGDSTFAATDSELRKMRSRTCQWYDVEVRGFLGSGNVTYARLRCWEEA